jgi:predicted nucleic acid-binding Zn ribbon protein
MGTSTKHQKAMNDWGKALSEKIRSEYYANPEYCQVCEGVIPFEKKNNPNCSMSCAATARNKGVRRHGNPGEVTNCLVCGNKTKPGKKYCSQSCSGSSNKFDIDAWLRGEITGNTALGCSGAIKKWLLNQCNHRCPKCGWGEVHPVTGEIPLEVNHIDGDSTNNSPENLEVLCPNCHSLTPNYRALNKKSSRTHRGLRKT